MKSTLSFLTLCLAFSLSGFTLQAQDYTLNVSRIEIKKSPQSGGWRAGATLKQEAQPDNQDIWHGGKAEFDSDEATLPVDLTVGNVRNGESMALFIGLDDDAEDAGNKEKAEDQLVVKFKVFPTANDEKVFTFQEKDWSIILYYTLTQ